METTYIIIPGATAYDNGVARSTNTYLFDGSMDDLPAAEFGDVCLGIGGDDIGKIGFYTSTGWIPQE